MLSHFNKALLILAMMCAVFGAWAEYENWEYHTAIICAMVAFAVSILLIVFW